MSPLKSLIHLELRSREYHRKVQCREHRLFEPPEEKETVFPDWFELSRGPESLGEKSELQCLTGGL